MTSRLRMRLKSNKRQHTLRQGDYNSQHSAIEKASITVKMTAVGAYFIVPAALQAPMASGATVTNETDRSGRRRTTEETV